MATVASIDVGYGNVKFAWTEDGKIKTDLFQAIAAHATSSECLTPELRRRNTVVAEVDGVNFEVGRDAGLAIDNSYQRVTDSDYPRTTAYHALLLGALSYIQRANIDVLVLGLPLLTYNAHKDFLTDKFVGRHKVPRIKHPDSQASDFLEVNVKNVIVYPQPLGGLLSYAGQNKDEDVNDQTSLIIDVGYYTLDWLFSLGLKPFSAKSDAKEGGMSSVLQSIAKSISGEVGRSINDLGRIDKAIRENRKTIKLYGKEIEITPHLMAGKEKARQLVSAVANNVGDGESVDNIVLVGGGAAFFEKIIAEKYPDHNVIVANDPVFSNVIGFQYGGLRAAKQLGN